MVAASGRRPFLAALVCAGLCGVCVARPLVVGLSERCSSEEKGRNVCARANYAEAVSKGGHLPVVIPRARRVILIGSPWRRLPM